MPKKPDDIITAEQAADLVAAKAKEHGTINDAAATWGCSAQMVHMVIKGARRPTPAMLDALGLEPVPDPIHYRKKP